MPFSCQFCGAYVSQSNHLPRHQSSEACRKVQAIYEAKEDRIRELEAENQNLVSELKASREKCEEYRSIVERAALRPTLTTTNNNQSRNNYLQYLSSEPIRFSTLEAQMPTLVTAEALMRGPRRFNKMLTSAILEDDEGKTKVLCTDQARKQFTYKDEKSGELVSDPSLERLRERMRAGVDYGTLYDEVLEELNVCEGDRTDNPAHAFLILQRAKFEAPFVRHVAKRAYKGAIINFEEDPPR